MPAMKVKLSIPVMPGMSLEVHESSPAEIGELLDLVRRYHLARQSATHEQLVDIGLALGVPKVVKHRGTCPRSR